MNKDSTAMDKAEAAWGSPLPDWVVALAGEIDSSSQNQTARKLGLSPATLSQTIRKAYPCPESVAERVRNILMADEIDCPGTEDVITAADCHDWQQTAWREGDPTIVHMRRACRLCKVGVGKGDAA